MAADARRTRSGDASQTDDSIAEQPKRLPKGVVLGKDGKPCRSCTSFAAWASQTKSSLKSQPTSSDPATSLAITSAGRPPPNDCPADVDTLGRSTWTLLHSIAATYPTTPTAAEQADLKGFLRLFSRLYPCWVCAEDFQQYIERQSIRAGSRGEFGNWLCAAHNEVNKKLGKPVFDCSKWEERWRTGWKDGRCD